MTSGPLSCCWANSAHVKLETTNTTPVKILSLEFIPTPLSKPRSGRVGRVYCRALVSASHRRQAGIPTICEVSSGSSRHVKMQIFALVELWLRASPGLNAWAMPLPQTSVINYVVFRYAHAAAHSREKARGEDLPLWRI